jgi:hypothetical protein
MPWRYTTIVDLVDHWQSLITGLIALIAATITVFVTLRVEQRKVDREIDALRKSIAVELRQLIPRALGVYTSLQKLGGMTADVAVQAPAIPRARHLSPRLVEVLRRSQSGVPRCRRDPRS